MDIVKVSHGQQRKMNHGVLEKKRGGSQEAEMEGKASFCASIFNLVNNVAGAGMLTLPAGMAMGSGTGYIPAVTICAAMGVLASHTFACLGKTCEMTGERDFKGLWGRTFGESTTYLVDSIIATQCTASCVIFSGVLGDIGTKLLSAAGVSSKYNARTSNILLITALCLLPLGMVKDLSALAFTSALGIVSVLYTVFFILVRSLDNSYLPPTGKYIIDDVITKPTFEHTSMYNFGVPSLILVCSYALAYIAHYNAPLYYRELHKKRSSTFTDMVRLSYTILIAMYIIVMISGYTTFGDACKGNILLNYHPSDTLGAVANCATFFSLLFGFPLVLRGAREAYTGLCSTLFGFLPHRVFLVTGLLAFITAVSVSINDVSLVVGLSGATLGVFLELICPSLFWTKAVRKQYGRRSAQYHRAKFNLLLIPFGCAISAMGVYMTLKKAAVL